MAISYHSTRSRDPAYQGFMILRASFVLAPILFGIDKFFNYMTDWRLYLAPWLNRLVPGTAQQFMYVVGVVEIVGGLLVLFWPRWGSLVIAAWLAGIVVNLLTYSPPTYYDIALRDFGLLLGALTLNRLATAFSRTRMISQDASDRLERRAA